MARIRTIKPEFWTDGAVIDLSYAARLFFIGTWNFALCDRGHLPDDARKLKFQILPADDVDAEAIVQELVDAGRIERITAGQRTFLHVVRFEDHQRIDSRWNSRCPVCAQADPPNPAETRTNSREFAQTHVRKGKEGKGEEGKGEVIARKRATQLPDTWQPNAKHQALAAELGVNLALEATKFTDYCAANGKTYKNHDSAFNNWLRNAKTFGGGRQTRQQETDAVYQRAMARARGEQS